MVDLPQTPQGPETRPAAQKPTPKDAPLAPPHDLLAEMIAAENEEVDWASVRSALDAVVTQFLEDEMRAQRERRRAVIKAVAPYLITKTDDEEDY